MSSQEILVSFIVPVYNVKEFLCNCIDSILIQTVKEIEIILVDDGSTDGSSELCDLFAEKDFRVRVIHQENLGLSEARNKGLNIARGLYTLFVDSDDYIEEKTCENLLEIALRDSLDIVIGMMKLSISNKIMMLKNHLSIDRIYSGGEVLKCQLRIGLFDVSACANMYRTRFLLKNELYFKKDILHEDIEWTPRVFLKAQKVGYSNYAFYNYRSRENSITTQKNKLKNSKDIINTCKEYECLCIMLKDNDLKNYLNDYIANCYMYAIRLSASYFIKNRREVDKSFPIKHAYRFKSRCWALLFNFNIKLYFIIFRIRRHIKVF